MSRGVRFRVRGAIGERLWYESLEGRGPYPATGGINGIGGLRGVGKGRAGATTSSTCMLRRELLRGRSGVGVVRAYGVVAGLLSGGYS